MKAPNFPEFIKNLSQADIPIEGITGWLQNGENGQVLFLQTDRKIEVPEHSHGDQWGIVIDGKMELTIAGKTEKYIQGDSYFIPAGTMHGAVLYKDFRALDHFADKERYMTK